jgi:hypothetical protein
MLQEQAGRACQIGNRTRQHDNLMRQERDYYGRIQAFVIEARAADDPELSSETGPQFRTLQWRSFYPSTELDTTLDQSVWRRPHHNPLSLDSMIADGDQI